jgi:hypothetical protein
MHAPRTGVYLIGVVLLGAIGAPAAAAPISPASYAMFNGGSGFASYRDSIYAGPGASGNPGVNYSFLAGGRGKLTDGVVGGNDILNPIVNGETPAWVGWFTPSLPSSPLTITFDFGQDATIESMGLHLANNSAQFNDVSLPAFIAWSISSDGATFAPVGTRTPTAAELANPDSQWIDFAPANAAVGRYLRATLPAGRQPWIFASESRFEGVIPAPGAAALLGLAGAVAARRRG